MMRTQGTYTLVLRALSRWAGVLALASCTGSCDHPPPAKGGDAAVTAQDKGSTHNQRPRTDEELRAMLTPEQYGVMLQNGTEPPFANEYCANKEPGLYVDRIAGTPLFSSREKFDSGCGWPSFTAPLAPDAVVSKPDTTHGMVRTEVRSKTSDGHLGHVFEDGPRPTGLRYCINSASLRFVPAARLRAEGYGEYASLFPDVAQTSAPAVTETATFAAGCFWGVEAAFMAVPGVVTTAVGYTGGSLANPTYKQVCTDTTGHAEAVLVTFDPAVTSYAQLLDVFWNCHDPTTPNRQGPDVGTQYRSAIFFHTPEQERQARAAVQALERTGKYKQPIATEIVAAGEFYPAEEYHQQYLQKRGKVSCGH